MTVKGNEVFEIEYVYYGTLKDVIEIKERSVAEIYQEQYSILKPVSSLRVRLEKDAKADSEDKDVLYELTHKKYKPGVNGAIEKTLSITDEIYKLYKDIADSGIIKIRYLVPDNPEEYNSYMENNPGLESVDDLYSAKDEDSPLVWEYDCFYNKDMEFLGLVKIDLEVYKELGSVPTPPIKLDNMITNQYTNRTEEEKDFIKEFFEKADVLKNKEATLS